MQRSLIAIVFFLLSFHAVAQAPLLRGTITDSKSSEPLIGVIITATLQSDTTRKYYATTDIDGKFELSADLPGAYNLHLRYLGYKMMNRAVTLENGPTELGKVMLESDAELLKGVDVEGKLPLATQLGDTTQYNADAFKTAKDADAGDLINKIPGITVENGTVKAQGEDLKRILVDGKPFFGDDPNVALRNLPADVIDKIQVYDQQSEQSQFTGFDDGNTTKTINIITRKDKRNGQFGKIYGGLGMDYRYIAGGNINIFDGDRKISILGLSNNINQQNFSSEDLVGVSSSGGSGQRGGGMGGGGGGRPGGSGGSSNFLVGQQNGIATTHAAGINFSDVWGKRKNVQISGSYFFNAAETVREQRTAREYFLQGDSSQFYNETSTSQSLNFNHRVNLRFEYEADSMNSFIFTPRFSLQDNTSSSFLYGQSLLEDTLLNRTTTANNSMRFGYTAGGEAMYRHRFAKTGRTLSWNLNGNYTVNNSETLLNSLFEYYTDTLDTYDSLNQRSEIVSSSYTAGTRLVYTEPVGKSGILQFNYGFTYANSTSLKETFDFDPVQTAYSLLDSLLSNTYDNTTITNRAEIGYRLKGKKFNLMIGAAYQNVLFDGRQLFPQSALISRVYHNALPTVNFNYKFSTSSNLRMSYRTSTNLPTVSQLQRVVDNSNPLILSSGNDALRQSYTHAFNTRYNFSNPNNAHVLFAMVSASYTQDYIGNQLLIAAADTTLQDGTFLPRGAQLTRPVNLEGYVTARSFFTYGFPVSAIKSNLNLNTSFSYSRTPGIINEQTNIANAFVIGQGITIASNFSDKVDFSVSYTGNYNIVMNSVRDRNNNNFFSQTGTARFNWQFWKGFVLNTNLNHTLYTGLTDGFNQSFFLWNASLGYKFLKDESLELKVTVFDLLDQNNSISRVVAETYVEDVTSNVLKRYFMVTLTFNLKNFKSAEK